MMSSLANGAAVFLDRDGTLIREVNYLTHVDQVEILPGVPEALQLLHRHGFKLVMVTNQSVVGRGRLSEEGLGAIHDMLLARLKKAGAQLDAVYYCPHHPTEALGEYLSECVCRKPHTGMIDRAARELGLDPKLSYVVGDQSVDLELAAGVGAVGVLIRHGQATALKDVREDVPVVAGMWEAAKWIIENACRSMNEGGKS